MHSSSHYKVTNQQQILEFIQQYNFATIVGTIDNKIYSSQIPLLIEQQNDKVVLVGHIIRKTDHYNALQQNNEALVVFNGPHTYISASWYVDPKGASTWNYQTVHARGKISFLDGDGTLDCIKKLTAKYEGENSLGSFGNMSDEYIKANLKAIAGFTIEVESFEAIFKLSQNKDEQTKKNIVDALRKRNDESSLKIADEIEKFER